MNVEELRTSYHEIEELKTAIGLELETLRKQDGDTPMTHRLGNIHMLSRRLAKQLKELIVEVSWEAQEAKEE